MNCVMEFERKKSRVFRKRSLFSNIIQLFKRKMIYVGHEGRIGSNLLILGNLPILKIPQNGKILIGNNVVLNSDKKHSNSALTSAVKLTTGYDGIIEIGDNTILNGACIVAYNKVEIGKFCEIASCTMISDTDFHPVSPVQRLKQMKGEAFSFDEVNKSPIKIGDNCWIGYGSIILKGCQIGENCIVAAGSVVPGGSIFPANCIIAGNPAKVVKYL